MSKYDERTTTVNVQEARRRGMELMEQWDNADRERDALYHLLSDEEKDTYYDDLTADDFATPGEHVMIVPAAEVKRGDHIVRFTGSPKTHDLRVEHASAKTVADNKCIALKVWDEINNKDAHNLLLYPEATVTIERPEWNL